MTSYSWITGTVPRAGSPARAPITTTAPIGTSYGIDLTTWAEPGQTSPDLDPNFSLIDERSQRGIVEAAARRLCMPRGFLTDVPDEGYDIRAHLKRKWTRRILFNVQASCEGEAEKDERVYNASASIKWNEKDKELTVRMLIDSMYGSFPMVMAIDDVTIAALEQR